jgi:hypothetical protein
VLVGKLDGLVVGGDISWALLGDVNNLEPLNNLDSDGPAGLVGVATLTEVFTCLSWSSMWISTSFTCAFERISTHSTRPVSLLQGAGKRSVSSTYCYLYGEKDIHFRRMGRQGVRKRHERGAVNGGIGKGRCCDGLRRRVIGIGGLLL